MYLSVYIQERPFCSLFLALGTLCFQTSRNTIFVKLHFHGIPSSSTKIQRKMNDIIVSHIMTGRAEISTDTSPCPNSKSIFFCQHILKGIWVGQVAAGAWVGKGLNGTRWHQPDPQQHPSPSVKQCWPRELTPREKASLQQWAAERTRTFHTNLPVLEHCHVC